MSRRAGPRGRNGTDNKPAAAAQKAIQQVHYAGHDIQPWFPSYYLDDIIGKGGTSQLYVCQHCFKYSVDDKAYAHHMLRACEYKDQWPGWACYIDNTHKIFELDGEEHLLFAQNLSLFGKLFIENKSVCFDVRGFTYYLLVENDQIVGFFSKEKLSWDNNNLACILVFPPFQSRGNGKKLMAASYAMSKREGRPGGPERPLSEPGKKSYEAYWCRAIADCILNLEEKQVTIMDICEDTFIVPEDVSLMLKDMEVVEKRRDGGLSINKSRVRDWVTRKNVDLRPPLDPAGFQENEVTSSGAFELDEASPVGSSSEDSDET